MKASEKMKLAERIDFYIKNRGFSKSAFAEKMNKKPSEVSKWLSGTHNFTYDTLLDISYILNIQISQLTGANEKPQVIYIQNFNVNAINEAFNNSGLTVIEMIIFDIDHNDIRGNLKDYLASGATRIVIVWAESIYTSFILQKALDLNLVGPYFTWILSSTISFDSFNRTFYQNLTGMLLIERVVGSVVNVSINQTLLDAAFTIWQQYENDTYPGSSNVNYYALFAFDATWTFIQSLQKLCSSTITNSSSCLSFVKSSFCFDNRFIQSNLLLDALSTTEFLGVSGSIKFTYNVTDRINGSYYSLKNVQPSVNGLHYVFVLEYSDPKHWRIPREYS
ncbi:unnamed protein product [Rotaria sp. Silwood2]|nr:unnamed protein product [Rotaria sp. Silwood2]